MGARLAVLCAALEASRADLLSVLDAIPDSELEGHFDAADVLWRVGLIDDWTRLVIDQALDGRPIAAAPVRARPAYLRSRELLRAWLDQTRSALLARTRGMDDTELAHEVALPSAARATLGTLLAAALDHEVECRGTLRLHAGTADDRTP